MLPYIEIAKAGWEVLQRAIKLGKQIKDKFSIHVDNGTESDRVFVPGPTTKVERFLQGKFPYIQGRYRVKYDGVERVIVTQHTGNENCPWEFQLEMIWWQLPNETIQAIEWIELLEVINPASG